MTEPLRARSMAGIALILVSGFLVILMGTLLAALRFAQHARASSGASVQGVGARLLARSGIEYARSRLMRGPASDPYPGPAIDDWRYREVNPDTPLEQAQNPSYSSSEPYGVNFLVSDNGRYDPGEDAFIPALHDRNGNGVRDVRSGRLRGRYLRFGDTYTLKIERPSGIHVNGGAPGDPWTVGYNGVLHRILGNLCRELDDADLPRDGFPIGETDGWALIESRPPSGWKNWSQIETLLGTPKADLLRPYLVLDAWVDRKVVCPNVAGPLDGKYVRAWAEIVSGVRDDASFTGMRLWNPYTGSYAPDFERDAAGRIVGRAPVEFHWVQQHPAALRALLTGLEGIYLNERQATSSQISPTGYYPQTMAPDSAHDRIGQMAKASLTLADVDAIVAAFRDHAGFADGPNRDPGIDYRFPQWDRTSTLDSREEFAKFVEVRVLPALRALLPPEGGSLPPNLSVPPPEGSLLPEGSNPLPPPTAISGVSSLAEAKASILLACFNPNSDLNAGQPNAGFFNLVDKASLTTYSPEFDFGVPRICVEALGRQHDAWDAQPACARARVNWALDQVRFTTQSEFMACDNGLGTLGLAGDETEFRIPGEANFIGPYVGPGGVRGHGAWILGTRGLSLQIYPEPQWGDGSPEPACYDGNLQLATLESDPAVLPNLRFLASWDDDLDAEIAPGGEDNQRDAFHVSGENGDLGTSLYGSQNGSALVNTLRPDGTYSEANRTPGYLGPGNVPRLVGTISYWHKLNYDPLAPGGLGYEGHSRRGHLHVNLSRGSSDTRTQAFYICTPSDSRWRDGSWGGIGGAILPNLWGFHFETWDVNIDVRHEHSRETNPRPVLPHRWYLFTGFYNLPCPGIPWVAENVAAFWIDGGTDPCDRPGKPLTYSEGNNVGDVQAITGATGWEPDGTHRFYLGLRAGHVRYPTFAFTCCGGADCTFDEFAILDAPPAGGGSIPPAGSTPLPPPPPPPVTPNAAGMLAAERFRDGRYSKADGTYTSCLVDLQGPVTIRDVRCTFQIPPHAGPADPNVAFHDAGTSADFVIEILEPFGYTAVPTPAFLPDGRFRFRVKIRPRLEDASRPLLSSPVLDDVTFLYARGAGFKVVDWEE